MSVPVRPCQASFVPAPPRTLVTGTIALCATCGRCPSSVRRINHMPASCDLRPPHVSGWLGSPPPGTGCSNPVGPQRAAWAVVGAGSSFAGPVLRMALRECPAAVECLQPHSSRLCAWLLGQRSGRADLTVVTVQRVAAQEDTLEALDQGVRVVRKSLSIPSELAAVDAYLHTGEGRRGLRSQGAVAGRLGHARRWTCTAVVTYRRADSAGAQRRTQRGRDGCGGADCGHQPGGSPPSQPRTFHAGDSVVQCSGAHGATEMPQRRLETDGWQTARGCGQRGARSAEELKKIAGGIYAEERRSLVEVLSFLLRIQVLGVRYENSLLAFLSRLAVAVVQTIAPPPHHTMPAYSCRVAPLPTPSRGTTAAAAV